MAKHLTIAEFMSTNVTTVEPKDSLLDVARIMEKQHISCVIVSEAAQGSITPLGIITEKNIVGFIAKQANAELQSIPAAALMPPTLVTINASDSLFEAMVLCRSQRIKHLAVVDSDKTLSGIITYSDLVDANYMQIEMQAELLGNAEDNEVNEQLLEMTLTDPMLKIGNRRSMEIDLKQTLELSQRYNRPFSIALIDIDYFKKYNDHYGHRAGDEALVAASNCLQDSIRSGDRLYRYGGEEFLLLMPETEEQAAEIVGQRLVEAIAELEFAHDKSPLGKLTTSVGASSITSLKNGDEGAIEDLIKQADDALYSAKDKGRNRSEIF